MEKHREIEKSIIKKYRKEIWSKFVKAIKEYDLITPGDKIAVCISGGKDSFLLAKCFDELNRHNQFGFDVKYIVMNPGYKSCVLKDIKALAQALNLDIEVFDTPIFKITANEEKPCYLCAKMRRGYLYDYAKKIGCNKIALGHHFDDVIETTMLNLLYAGSINTMNAKVASANFEEMGLIRPLYYIRERDIIKWAKSNELSFIRCGCEFETKGTDGKRVEVKNLIKQLENTYKDIPKSIFTALDKTSH